VLRVERVDNEFPAGAVWNFPNGRKGTVRIRFQLLPGAAATAITLTDHFSSPFDDEAEWNGLFTARLKPGDGPADALLREGTWHDLELSWDAQQRTCAVSLDGRPWKELPQLRILTEGANYLRFRTLANGATPGGIRIESVAARVELVKPATDATVLP